MREEKTDSRLVLGSEHTSLLTLTLNIADASHRSQLYLNLLISVSILS